MLGKTMEISAFGLINSIRKVNEGVVYFGNTEAQPALVLEAILIQRRN